MLTVCLERRGSSDLQIQGISPCDAAAARRRASWLQIPERITFQLAVLAYRSLNVLAPQYLADDLHQVAKVESRRRLSLAVTAALIVPAMARSTIG